MTDRPWGVTLGGLARSGATGQLVLQADDGKRFNIAFLGGAIVGATSPLAADSVARIALTSQLVTSSQVQDIARKVAAFPDRDEVAFAADIARLTPDQCDRLRRRMVLQRAARSFSVERGMFELQAEITIPVTQGIAVDAAAVIYLGAAMNLTELRLAADIRELGGRFVMKADRLEDLGRFGFTDAIRPMLEDLYAGTSLPELDAKYRDLEPRTMQAVIYALVSTDLCEGMPAPGIREIRLDDQLPAPRAARSSASGLLSASGSGSLPRAARASQAGLPRSSPPTQPPPPSLPSIEDAPPRSRTVTFESPTALRRSPLAEGTVSPAVSRTVTPRRNVATVRATVAAVLSRAEQGADHFELLGLPFDASIDAVRSAYVRFASLLHPDKLPPLGPAELRDAQLVLGHIAAAFQVLTDPVRRADYVAGVAHAGLARGSRPPGRQETVAETAAAKTKLAAEASERGLAALRRDDTVQALIELNRAVEYCPQDVDHQATLAWGKFCAAADKTMVALETRRVLERALYKSHNPIVPRFFLGRVERMLGRSREALHHFKEVIALDPQNHEAKTEIRLLELRGAGISDRRRR